MCKGDDTCPLNPKCLRSTHHSFEVSFNERLWSFESSMNTLCLLVQLCAVPAFEA
jgi:hypothetical protein